MNILNTPRDISLLQLNKKEVLVIASDSAGALGQKPQDQVKVSNQILGKYTVKVPLMEVISVGAEVISVIDNLAVEYEPTGREIIAGINSNLKLLKKTSLLNGSTEENIKTVQTALGVTVIGKVSFDQLNKYSKSKLNEIVAAVGLPLVGKKLLKKQSKAVNFKKFLKIVDLPYIKQLLPVGSKGIKYELNILAQENNFDFEIFTSKEVKKLDLEKSAGPSTVILVSLAENNLQKLKEDINLPVTKIAKFVNSD